MINTKTHKLGLTRIFCALALIAVANGCGIYSFSGSTLPSHLKTVSIPLFFNSTAEPGLAETVTEILNNRMRDEKLLSPVSSGANAEITGRVVGYTNNPYSYTSEQVRSVDVNSYQVIITVEVEFYDNVKDKSLYKGTISEYGIYDFGKETEQQGRERAAVKIVDKIMQSSVQSW